MYNNELFIAELNTNKIIKIIPQTLNINEVELANNGLYIYPNPSKSKIRLANNLNNNIKYKMFNSLGIKINEGIFSNNEITIDHLESGMYYIQLENNKTLKFIKN